MKTSISNKTSRFVGISVGVMAIFLLLMVFVSVWKMRFDTIGYKQKQDADIFSNIITQRIDDEVSKIQSYLSSPWWRDAVKEANLRYLNWKPEAINEYMAQMDERWMGATDNQVVKEMLDSRMSQRLKILTEKDNVVAEIFLTDQYGGLVAASGKTSDYYQADESWWQYSYNKGKGDIFFGEVELDESIGKISSAIAVPLKDDTGRVFGVSKTMLDIDVFFQPLIRYEFGKTGHVSVLNKDGSVIYHSGLEPMSKSGFSKTELERILRNKKGFVIMEAACLKTKAIVAAVEIKSPHLQGHGMNWIVLVTQSQNEVFLPLYRILGGGLFLIVIISFLIMLGMRNAIQRIFISPLQKIRDGMQRFSRGEQDYRIGLKTGDELEDLAHAFNNMSDNIDKTTISRDYLDNIIESMTDSLIVISSDAAITSVNKATCGLLGYQEEELVGKDVSIIFPEEEIPLKGTKLGKLLKEGVLRNYEINYKAKNGKIIPVILSGAVLKRKDCHYGEPGDDSPSFKEKGKHCEKILGAVYVAKDITERKKAEGDLINEKAFRENTINSISDVFYAFDMNGNFIFWNDAFRKVTGYSDAELHAMKATDFFSGEDVRRIIVAIGRIWKDGVSKEGADFITKSGSQLPFEFTGSVLKDGAGNTIGFSGIGRDVSERKKMEDELRSALKEEAKYREIMTSMLDDTNQIREKLEQSLKRLKDAQTQLIHAEKMEAVGRMASGVAHEVKNPLGLILQGVYYLEKTISPERKESREVLQMMRDSVKRADGIVRALLDFSRAGDLKLEREDINKIIESSIELVRHGLKFSSIGLVCELEKNLPKISVDIGKVQQVFVNLFNNAVDVMPKGGKLYIKSYLSCLEESGSRVSKREKDILGLGENVVVVEVEDTGPGIDKNIIGKIFDPFFTTKNRAEGTGLGLSVSKNIIDMHKGLVSVKSEKNKGAKFTIIFKLPKEKEG